MWAQKKWGLFYVDSQKWGSFSVQKIQFQAKICKSYVKITAKFRNFSKCARSAREFALCLYDLIRKWEKRVMGVDSGKIGVIGCKIGVKKVY